MPRLSSGILTLSDMERHCKESDGTPNASGSAELPLDQGLLRHCALAWGISYNSQEHGGITLATVAHGAFGLAVAAMSGNLEDAAFQTIRMGCQLPLKGAESMMGLMLCLVPLRIPSAFNDTILNMLQSIQEVNISTMSYEQLASETLPVFPTRLPILNWRLNNVDIFQRNITFTTGGS